MRELLVVVPSGQHVDEAAIDARLRDRRQSVEGLRIDEIAQRITRQSALEIQLPQRAAGIVERAAALEARAELGASGNRRRELRLADEEHRLDERLDAVGDDRIERGGR